MTFYLSYKYTGVPREELAIIVEPLVEYLRSIDIDVFCNLEREEFYIKEKWSVEQIMQDCFDALERCCYHITYVAPSGKTSEGMLIELGYAIKMGLPTLMLVPCHYDGLSARAVVDNVIVYKNYLDLSMQLQKFLSDTNKN